MPLDIAALRQQFRAAKSELLTQFQHSRPTSSSASLFLKRMAQLVDDTLTTLWQAHALPPDAALVAVGGYGRAELFPHSDVDVLLLLPLTPQPGCNDTTTCAIEGFISACWDTGLEIGSSVRTVAECIEEAQRDVTVQTSLLEARYLCGETRSLTDIALLPFIRQFAAIDPAWFAAQPCPRLQGWLDGMLASDLFASIMPKVKTTAGSPRFSRRTMGV